MRTIEVYKLMDAIKSRSQRLVSKAFNEKIKIERGEIIEMPTWVELRYVETKIKSRFLGYTIILKVYSS